MVLILRAGPESDVSGLMSDVFFMANPNKILVLCLAGVGDVLMATPLLRELRQAYPTAILDVLVMQTTVARDILAGNPNVNTVHYFNFMAESRWRALAFCFKLRKERYDCSLSPMPQNRVEYDLVAKLVGARERVGFDYIHRGLVGHSFCLTKRIKERADLHVVDNNLRLLPEALGIPLSGKKQALDLVLTAEHRRFAQDFRGQHALSGPCLIGFHPGSGTTKNLALRRWPTGKWAELARLLAAHDDTIRIVMFGAASEQSMRDEIQSKSGLESGRLTSACPGNILESAALMAEMDCFVCCDTLLTHIAAAVQVPTVEILGPTDPRSIYPYGVPHRIVRTGIACSPCYVYSRHGIRCTNPEPMKCLNDVSPEMVFKAVIDMMNGI